MVLRFCKSRTYHDPLHGAISLEGGDPVEALLIRLIDTPAFQRLRRIRQLDTAYFTFHGAEGSRFTHSVGVLYIARRVFDKLAKHHPELKLYRALVLVSALLHDIGHGPFSHAVEDIFGYHHETWTQRLIQEDPHLSELLATYDEHLPGQMLQVLNKTFEVPLVIELVSSQLDCDRFDYLMRDSLLTGAQYGRLDLDRLITVIDYDPDRRALKISARKGLGPLEHYLSVRYFMYTQVYQHPKSIAARFVLDRLFNRARILVQNNQLLVDPILMAWLTRPIQELPLPFYLAADDIMFSYPFRFWTLDPDPVLQDLSRRYLDRDLLKARRITHLDKSSREYLKNTLAERLQRDGLDPDFYLGIRASRTQGYTLYKQGISLQTESGLEEIAKLSPLVKSLTTAYPQHWIIFPRRYGDLLDQLLRDL